MNWTKQVWTMLRAQRRRNKERRHGLDAAERLANITTVPTSVVAGVASRGFRSDARRRLTDLQGKLD